MMLLVVCCMCSICQPCQRKRAGMAANFTHTACCRPALAYLPSRGPSCPPPHRLGLTRTNVYSGLAGFYFVREKFPSIANGPELPGLPYPAYDGIIPLDQVRELPLAIQDRSFTADSQLWYPVANNPAGQSLPTGPLHPRWIPEYSATVMDPVTGVATNYLMMTVNGKTYPRKVWLNA